MSLFFLKSIFYMLLLFSIFLSHAAATSSTSSTTISFSKYNDFNLTWSIVNATTIEFSLAWNNSSAFDYYDWAAFGLNSSPQCSMADAEIFICNPTPTETATQYCQVRNSLAGFVEPAVDKQQYITLMSSSVVNGISTATFQRTLAAVSGSELSFNITNNTMGLIYARGSWSGDSMPSGFPNQHKDVGITKVNFYGQQQQYA